MLKKSLFILLLFLRMTVSAQTDNSVFQFLRLPFSAHAAALGGENISLIKDDLTMAANNPALLSCVSDRSLNLNYMLYMQGTHVASAAFSRMATDRASWGVTAQFLSYGKLRETTPDNITLGDFSPKDIAIGGMFSYDLSDYWSGGIRANLIYSKYGPYSSFAVGVDLGLNYYWQARDFSISLVARNLGAQIVAYDDLRERLPIDLQFGLTKRLAHAPVRISATFYNLADWHDSNFLHHAVVGVDVLPTQNIFLGIGYNFQRAAELKAAGSSHWAGVTAGAGIDIKRVKIAVAYGRYHLSASSLVFNLSLTL